MIKIDKILSPYVKRSCMISKKSCSAKITHKKVCQELGKAAVLTLGQWDRSFSELARPNAWPEWAKRK